MDIYFYIYPNMHLEQYKGKNMSQGMVKNCSSLHMEDQLRRKGMQKHFNP